MTLTASSELKAQSLCLTVQTYRWSFPPEVSPRALGALVARLSALTPIDTCNARKTRLHVTAALIGRDLQSFNELRWGEVKALLEEPDLAEIVEYILERSK